MSDRRSQEDSRKEEKADKAIAQMHQDNRKVLENQQRIDKTAQDVRQAVKEARK